MFTRYRGAGLIPLEASAEHLLVVMAQGWRDWYLMALHQGVLAEIAAIARGLPLALGIADEQCTLWYEDVPLYLSATAVERYLHHSKAELLAVAGNHLTIEVLSNTTTPQLCCWVLNQKTRDQLCQPYQGLGLTIGALEPQSSLQRRVPPRYHDTKGLLTSLDPILQPMFEIALKLACRHDWALT